MEYVELVRLIADILKTFNFERPIHKAFRLGIRSFGDNGQEADNWSVNLLHPYHGNVSLIGDAIKLSGVNGYRSKGLFVMVMNTPSHVILDPLISSFELIATQIMGIPFAGRLEERRDQLVHPEHQILRSIGRELQ